MTKQKKLNSQAAAFFSLAVVVVSTATFVLSTLEEFQAGLFFNF